MALLKIYLPALAKSVKSGICLFVSFSTEDFTVGSCVAASFAIFQFRLLPTLVLDVPGFSPHAEKKITDKCKAPA